MIPLAQNPPTKLKNFSSILNFTTPLALQGLNNSLAQSAAELWLAKVCPGRANHAFTEKFWIRPNAGFLTHNFGHRYASKSIKGPIDTDFDLVYKKTLSQKSGSMGWGPGPAKRRQNFQNMPSLWRHHQKAPTESENFFFDIDYKTCWIRRWFEQLSSSMAWRVKGLQSYERKVAHTGLRGSNNLWLEA